MSKHTTDNKVKVETWTPRSGKGKTFTKVAVRNSLGQFHGATNFRGSVLKKG
jgi:hypothetical protein